MYAGAMKDKHTAGRLVLEKVSHSYGDISVLNDLTLVVNPGEIVVLVGPSGCGKTTILNLLSGHIEPVSALDYQARLRMRRELIRLLEKRPRTVVFVTHDIEEAAQLADRVLVLSNRPATICRELHISALQPRDLTDSEVIEAMKEIFKELGLQARDNTDTV